MDRKHVGYARETAMCVDLAYTAMEEDLVSALERCGPEETKHLARLLCKLRQRRTALAEFSQISGPAN